MAYPVAMEPLPALSHEVWQRTPPEAQAYIRALAARVATLEAMMQAWQAQLHQTSRNSSRPPSSHPPRRGPPSVGRAAGGVGTRAARAPRQPGYLRKRPMGGGSRTPPSVRTASPP